MPPREARLRPRLVLGLAALLGLLPPLLFEAGLLQPLPARLADLRTAVPAVGVGLGLLLAGAALVVGAAQFRGRRFRLLAAGLAGAFLLGLGGAVLADSAGPGVPPEAPLAVGALAVLAAGAAALREVAWRRAPRSQGWARVARNAGPVLAALLLFAGYLALRPRLVSGTAFLQPWEYLVGLFAALLLLRQGLRAPSRGAPPRAWASRARRHATRVHLLPDPRFRDLTEVLEAWVEAGSAGARRRYEDLVESCLAASSAGRAQAEEVRRLLADAARPPSRKPLVPFGRRRAEEQGRDHRLLLHQRIVDRLAPPQVKP